jgi:hypothetical protein
VLDDLVPSNDLRWVVPHILGASGVMQLALIGVSDAMLQKLGRWSGKQHLAPISAFADFLSHVQCGTSSHVDPCPLLQCRYAHHQRLMMNTVQIPRFPGHKRCQICGDKFESHPSNPVAAASRMRGIHSSNQQAGRICDEKHARLTPKTTKTPTLAGAHQESMDQSL